MIGISSLLYGLDTFGDTLRYNKGASGGVYPGRGPVVVWNCTRACNLHCVHCYADASGACGDKDELTTAEGLALIDDLAGLCVPVLLMSGGEPLLRPDFFDLIRHAGQRGVRVTVSTNGTLIDRDVAHRLKEAGVSYVGISLDGLGEKNDFFRGRKGAYEAALKGIRNCRAVGQKVGLRFTLSRHNCGQLDDIFKLIEAEDIPRACFYHLVYTGRGKNMVEEDLSHEETRAALDLIIDKVHDFYKRGLRKEILTVDNHADAVYVYLYLKKTNPELAEKVLPLLAANGGNRSGMAIGQIDWRGEVHPDQFSPGHVLGNVRKQPFSAIWSNERHPLLGMLRDRKKYLQGRCASCRWLDLCNGNFRARAYAVGEDLWAPDPACYLTDEEIAR